MCKWNKSHRTQFLNAQILNQCSNFEVLQFGFVNFLGSFMFALIYIYAIKSFFESISSTNDGNSPSLLNDF